MNPSPALTPERYIRWDGTSGRRLDSTERYYRDSNTWKPSPPLTTPRYGLAAVLV